MMEKMFYAAIKYGWNEAKKKGIFLSGHYKTFFFLWVEERATRVIIIRVKR